MKKLIFAVIILAILIISFLSYSLFQSPEQSLFKKENSLQQSPSNQTQITPEQTAQQTISQNNQDAEQSTTQTETISSTASSQNTPSNSTDNEENTSPACYLIRPGNLPNIICSVNSITENSVSINITNEIGQPMTIKASLNNCAPQEIEKTIRNNQSQDIVFSCINSEFFSQNIAITYILEDKQIQVFGIVQGPVAN